MLSQFVQQTYFNRQNLSLHIVRVAVIFSRGRKDGGGVIRIVLLLLLSCIGRYRGQQLDVH